jgi:hypothetical protein
MKIDTIKEYLQYFEKYPEFFRKGTDFEYSASVSFVKFGSFCDSSDQAKNRAEYVEKALKEFINMNKLNILENAAQLAEEDYIQIMKKDDK